MGQDIRSAIARYAIYKAEKKTVLLVEKWKKIERQLSIVAGLLNDSREIEAALVQTPGIATEYVDHIVAAKKLFDMGTNYCKELMSQTEFGGKLVKFFFVEASKEWNAELKEYSSQLLPVLERGEFWMPPSLFLDFKKMLIVYRLAILEPIISVIQQKRMNHNRNPLNGGRPNDRGLQELLLKAESAGVSVTDVAALLVAYGIDGKPTGARSTRVRREAKRLATAMGRLKSSLASAVPVGTKPRKPT